MADLLRFIGDLDLRSVLLSTGIFLVIFWWLSQYSRYSNLPPGPVGWPLLGYLPNLGISLYRSGKQPFQLFADLANRYGKVYSLYMGRRLVVILNGHEAIKEAFMNQLLNDRPALGGSQSELNTGVLFANGPTWRNQRRFTLSAFRDFGIGKSKFQNKISEEIQFVTAEFSSYGKSPVDPKVILTNAISNVISSVIFGHRFEYSDTDFHRLLVNLDKIVNTSGSGGINVVLPILQLLDFRTKRRSEIFKSEIRAFIGRIIANHKANFDSNHLSDYIDVYFNELEHGDISETENVDEKSLLLTVIQVFIAGTETTVNTLRWALMYLMEYPEIQIKIQKEIDSVAGRNRLPRVSDKLSYLEATIMEVQRISSIAPLGVPHSAADDTTIQGYTIPKDSLIFSNIWAVHHDPALWNDPEEFRPERFLNENGVVLQPDYYMPFSTGRRMCLGEGLAKMELFLFITQLLHRFTFSRPANDPPLSFKGRMGATNSPFPFRFIVTERG